MLDGGGQHGQHRILLYLSPNHATYLGMWSVAPFASQSLEKNKKLRTLPASLGRLHALKALTLRGLSASALLYLPDLRFFRALEGLTLDNCHQLEVPASIMHLSQRSSYRSLPVSNLKKHTNRER